jgi:hypothetical protein
VSRGLHQATTEAAQIRRWWARWPQANVAIRTGEISGLVVLDVDPDHRGDASLAGLVSRYGDLPPGRTIRTGSGGRHLYFAHPGRPVGNDTGRRLGHGLDVRGDGGYVIAPPSRHVSGTRYSVAAGGIPLPDLPDWLGELLRRAEPPWRPASVPGAAGGPPGAWARAALEREMRRLRDTEVGTRNHTLNRIAFRIGQIVGAGHLEEAQAEHVLLEGAAVDGLGKREAIATVHSGLRAGERFPRGPTGRHDSPDLGLP